ncbi:carboxylesterase family protein-like protein [Aulographum hederae CBS 113979]|uniref:Carboxylic ester hydrolase n=1 Tax=Aulographum hederae CBS 113979 TaxID=1176131 RepID=A0A6G1GQ92_9PEZI|nr:carboxylesterase family protein-like protein [Aulographum hederae CBS 113979]
MNVFLFFVTVLLSSFSLASATFRHEIIAKVKNGTYAGVHSEKYNQDFFLGIPYAQPPVGDLRFRVTQSLNSSWEDAREATQYSKECVGYGSDQWNYETSEDCLYLNVVRPSGLDYTKLPVAFWIHGGGYFEGGAPDQRYNLSFMIENSVKLGKPVIGVSINYRLAGWGFLNSDEIVGSGNTNLGLRDQRLAMHWVKENIESFGGDASKIVIWGESAGGSSVGFHLTAYNGRDDDLFRGAIMESGNPVPYFTLNGTQAYQPLYDNVTASTNCSDAIDTLQCLRTVPYAVLNAAFNRTGYTTGFHPVVDGDFIQKYPSIGLAEGAFVQVPIISGTNSDEGTSFGPRGVDTTDDFFNYLVTDQTPRAVSPEFAEKILEAYPDDPSYFIPSTDYLPANARLPATYGAEYRRSSAYYGDAVFLANRRQTCEYYAAAGQPVYSYRFNALPAGNNAITGVGHFQEIAFVFLNLDGIGYEPAAEPPFQNKTQSYRDLARLMDSSWISFVSSLDPNDWEGRGDVPPWPKYELDDPKNIVFDANVTSFVEADTWRKEGIKLINDNSAAVYHR